MTAPYHYAGFWHRTGAYGVDVLLAFILLLPYTYLLEQLLQPLFAGHNILYGISEFLLSDVSVMALTVFFWVKHGATPGMMLLELRVIDASSGQHLSWLQAIARLFMRLLAIMTILGVIMLAWDRRKQALHDKICNTLIVDAQDDYEYQYFPGDGAWA